MLGVLLICSAWSAEVVDATLPLVLASAEITAMGGAGLGFVSGASGLGYSPAAPALRRITNTGSKDASAALSSMLSLKDTYLGVLGGDNSNDLTNAGARYGSHSEILANAAAAGRIRRVGGGVDVTGVQVWGNSGSARITDGRLALAGGALDGWVAAGVAGRMLSVHLDRDGEVERFVGFGAEMGVSLAPETHHWRLGLAARTPVRATSELDGGFKVEAVQLPWQLSVGGGWANDAAQNSFSEGRGARVGLDVVLYGPVADGIALAPMMEGTLVSRGQTVSVSPRLGGEYEVWPTRLRVRGGTYIEPSRTEGRDPRWHVTGGAELRVIHLRLLGGFIDHHLSVQSVFDLSERYQKIGWLGLSFWDAGVVSAAHPEPPPE